MKMHNPAHPGEMLAGWLEDLNTSVTAFAGHLGLSRVMLSRVLNGHAAVSADLDLRLSEAWGTHPGECCHPLRVGTQAVTGASGWSEISSARPAAASSRPVT
jgi:addiction module HigA family antidote